jgi:hypothetical protein
VNDVGTQRGLTEQHGHPNNRWRHVVGASDLGSADALPTWHWNGSSNFHPRAETPAPYVHVGHGGKWFDESSAVKLLMGGNMSKDDAEAEVNKWKVSVTQASLDLKFGMRRAFIDKDIILPTQPGGKPQYRSTSGNLTDLEVGDAGAPFPTWWNDLSKYELEYGGQVKPRWELPIENDSETFTHLLTQPLPYASLVGSDVFTANSDMPLQMGIDNARYQYVKRSDNNAHLFKSQPWLEQIWCYNRYKGAYSSADSNQSMLQHDALRPHTAEELRLSLASAMIFGAKGYMFFAGSAGHDYTEDNEELYERGMWNHNHEGGGPCSNPISTTCALSTCPTTAWLASLIWGNDTTTSSHFGDDFPIGYAASQDPNSALIPRFFKKLDGQRRGFIISNKRMHGAEVFKTDPNNQWTLYSDVNATGLEPTEVYVGFKSPRREILRHVEKIMSKAPAPLEQTSGASNDVTWSELLSELSLRAWHGKGYGLMTVTDPASPENYLNSFIETSSITTRWPYREKSGVPAPDGSGYTGTPDYEPSDSSFYDVTILSKEAKVDGTFYVGVVNRRTNPVVVENAADPATRRYRFVTPYDMETDAALSSRPYQQVGAREITLPFRYRHRDGHGDHRKRLLRITEVGPPNSPRTLDTIIAEDQRLALNYLPGEGRLFRVEAFTPSTNTDANGYLAFNTQTKLIAAPVYRLTGLTMQATGLVRYHMVYFRQDNVKNQHGEPIEQWNVYYRRSKPLDPQKVSDLTQANPWEPAEYRLNDRIHVRFEPNGWPLGDYTRLYQSTADLQKLRFLDTPADAPRRLDAGFPALTVTREPGDLVARVRVVFTCTDATMVSIPNVLPNQPVSALMIAECSFPDMPILEDEVMTPRIGDARALVCVMATTAAQPGKPTSYTIDDMARWGTPVISSALGRTYYAWSAEHQPIGVGSKPATQDWFTADNQIHAVEWLPDVSDHRFSVYPTLIPYANIHAGETTSSLAWTESWAEGANDRTSIRYTRLKTLADGEVTHYLPELVPDFSLWLKALFGGLPWGRDPDLLIQSVGQTVDIGQSTESGWLPSITRSVQQEDMRLTLFGQRTMPYQFETITWQSTAAGNIFGGPASSIIRRRHFLHTDVEQPPGGQTQERMHYWYNQSTYSSSMGLMHPTVNIARHRQDDFPLSGLHLTVEGGNRSDTATMTTYAALPRQTELEHRVGWLFTIRDWWTGGAHNAAAAVDQLSLLYGPYGTPTNLVHGINNTRTRGMWPHIASRQDPTTVPATYGMRRIQQTGATHPPTIVFDAASFYKPEAAPTPPAIYRGVSTPSGELVMRLVDGQGRALLQHFALRDADEHASPTLVAATDVLSGVHDMDLGFAMMGSAADSIRIVIDEVDALQRPISTLTLEPAMMGLDGHAMTGRTSGRLMLVNGAGRSYRIGVASAKALIPCEVLELDPEDLTIAREPLTTTVLVDLDRESRTGSIRCLLQPVPASDALSVITPAGTGQDLVVTITEPRGAVVRRRTISRSDATIDIRDLAVGVYTVTVTDASGRMLHQQLLPVIR